MQNDQHLMMGICVEQSLCLVFSVLIAVCSAKELVLRPNDPNVVVGGSLKLRCTLSPSSSYTTNDIGYEFDILVDGKRQRQPVHVKYLKVVNNTSILNMSNLTVEHDRSTFSCFIKSRKEIIDSQMIRVGYKPDAAIIVSTIVKNWETFEFTWKTDREDYLYDTPYTAWFSTRKHPEFKSCSSCDGPTVTCPHQNAESTCSIPAALEMVHPDGRMLIKVNASNLLGNSTSENYTLDLFHHIKPEPVRNLQILPNGSHPLVLQFLAPQPKVGWKHKDDVMYNISITCDHGRNALEHLIIRRSMKISLTLENLPLFAMCSVSVRCKPYYINPSYGYWSEPQFKIFRSQEGVPRAVPEICSTCFFITAKEAGYRDVVIYFKNLDPTVARGIVCQYQTCLTNISSVTATPHISSCSSISERQTKECSWNTSSVLVRLPLDGEYQLAVVAATSAGFNQYVTIDNEVTIPDQSSLPAGPSNITAIVQHDLTVDLYWNGVLKAKSYDVAWCEDRTKDFMCRNFQRIKLDSSHTKWRITGLNQSRNAINNMIFGVAVEFDTFSRGIVWTDCTFDALASPYPPIVNPAGSTETTVTLSIQKPLCIQSKAFVYGFVIYYSEQGLPDSKGKKVVIDQRELLNGLYTVNGLQPDTSYTFVVESLSVGTASYKNSAEILVRTPYNIWSKGNITGISISCFIGLVLIIIGVIAVFRWNRKRCTAYWRNLPIVTPTYKFTQPASKDNDYDLESRPVSQRDTENTIVRRDDADGEERNLNSVTNRNEASAMDEDDKDASAMSNDNKESSARYKDIKDASAINNENKDEKSTDMSVYGVHNVGNSFSVTETPANNEPVEELEEHPEDCYAKCAQMQKPFSLFSAAAPHSVNPHSVNPVSDESDEYSSVEDDASEDENSQLLESGVDQSSETELDSYTRARPLDSSSDCYHQALLMRQSPPGSHGSRSSGVDFYTVAGLSAQPVSANQSFDGSYTRAQLFGNSASEESNDGAASNINTSDHSSVDSDPALVTDDYYCVASMYPSDSLQSNHA